MALWNGRLTELLMTATDPAGAAAYWADLFGGEAENGALRLGAATRIELAEGPREALAEMRFEAGPELVEAVSSLGAPPQSDRTLRLTDPDGWRLSLTPVDEVQQPDFTSPMLSHCTLGSPSPPSQRAYYESLRFLLSDQLGDIFCWLRPNPVHHSVAFAKAAETNINHIAIELPDSAAFIAAIDRVVEHGAKLEFGPGRHLVGNNLFAYLRDRYGIRWELCAEMNRVEPDRPPGLLTPEDRARSVNTFGPPPPPSFINEPGGPPPASVEAAATAE